MTKKSSKSSHTPLEQLTQAADPTVLRDLVHTLAIRPEIRRQAIKFCRIVLSWTHSRRPVRGAKSPSRSGMNWNRIWRNSMSMAAGRCEQEERVGELLYQLVRTLEEGPILEDDRAYLLDELIPFIRSGNSGMEDSLYDVAYAACQTNDSLRLCRAARATRGGLGVRSRPPYLSCIGDGEKYLCLVRG